ncbi:MAG TPA: LpqB family beta-propeller domain-containing protein [Mycobacteriales bacterium]|nr:LpqB family beta-propeller domain-containing protein [Mycobacteriales bacterium]
MPEPRRLPAARRGAMVAVAALLAAGCAGVPVSGSVHIGRGVPPGSDVEPNDIREDPAVPYLGITPDQLVEGFLNALVDSDGNYATARLYLASGTSWHPPSGAVLYDGLPAPHAGTHTVNVDINRVGVVDGRGDYRVDPGILPVRFSVVRASGQWRISHLPAQILLSTADAERTLQSVSLYYFDRSQSALVPEPILVPPDAAGLATTLLRDLIDGPGPALRASVVNALPHGTGLVGNVTVGTDGIAEVDLGGAIEQASGGQLQRVSAQIVWTLRQVSSVTGVRLLLNGAPLPVPGAAQVQPVGSWSQFDPRTPPGARGALFADRGRIHGLSTGVPPAMQGSGLEAPALSADGTMAAALRVGRRATTLVVGPSTGSMHSRLTAAVVSPPAFDPDSDVLVAETNHAGSHLVEVSPSGSIHRVAVPESVRMAGIRDVAVSRDGARIAMVVGASGHTELMVGGLAVQHGVTTVVSPALVVPSTSDVSGLAWAGANEIVTTAAVGKNRRAIIETTVDGYQRTTLGGADVPRNPTQVAAAPGASFLAAAGGRVWMLTGAHWRPVATGADPSYAG